MAQNPLVQLLGSLAPAPAAPFQFSDPRQLQAQAEQQAAAMYGPAEQMLRQSFASQLASGQAAIAGSTSAAAREMRNIAPQVATAYSQAQNLQRQLDTTLADRLTSSGQSLASMLDSSLGQSGIGPTGTAGLADRAGDTAFAMGSASQSQLLAQGAAAQAYAHELPGLMQLHGADSQRMLQLSLNQQLGQQLGGLYADQAGAAFGGFQDLQAAEQEAALAQREQEEELRQWIRQTSWNGLLQLQKQGFDLSKLGFQETQDTLRNTADNRASIRRQREREAAQDARQAARLAEAARQKRLDRENERRETRGKAVASRNTALEKAAAGMSKDALALLKSGNPGKPAGGSASGNSLLPSATTGPKNQPYTYNEAYLLLYERYKQQLKRYGIKPKRIQELLQGALVSAGFRRPGAR